MRERECERGIGGVGGKGKGHKGAGPIRMRVTFVFGKEAKTCCNQTHKAINAAIKRYMKNRKYAGQQARRAKR